jgi:hypothetical protein
MRDTAPASNVKAIVTRTYLEIGMALSLPAKENHWQRGPFCSTDAMHWSMARDVGCFDRAATWRSICHDPYIPKTFQVGALR